MRSQLKTWDNPSRMSFPKDHPFEHMPTVPNTLDCIRSRTVLPCLEDFDQLQHRRLLQSTKRALANGLLHPQLPDIVEEDLVLR